MNKWINKSGNTYKSIYQATLHLYMNYQEFWLDKILMYKYQVMWDSMCPKDCLTGNKS